MGENELKLYDPNDATGKFYFYDFTIPSIRKCIEFNGDIFHANPLLYSAEDHPNPFLKEASSADIWKKDQNKLQILKDAGFEFLIIWESEYNNNKEAAINKCVNFILDNKQEQSNPTKENYDDNIN